MKRRGCRYLAGYTHARGLGYDLLEAVKADPRWSSIPFIFISATVRWRIVHPVDPQQPVDELEECLRGHKE